MNIISKIRKTVQRIISDKKFSFKCLVVGFISIITIILYGTVLSIIYKTPWEKVEGCVENSFLAFVLLFIIINYIRGNKGFKESLLGELLAIYLVTNTTYFVESLIDTIENESIYLDYIYLSMEFLLMATSFAVFIDYLYKSENNKVEESNRIIVNVLLILVFVAIIIDFILILLYNDLSYTLDLLEEIIYAIFGTSLAFTVLSEEYKRVEGI